MTTSQTSCGKVSYSSATEAHAAATILRNNRNRKAKAIKGLRAYRCATCGAHHLAHDREIRA